MNRDEEFEKWYDEYFGNTQGEDSPYTYNDVKIAFFKGFKVAKENLTKHNSRKNQSVTDKLCKHCGSPKIAHQDSCVNYEAD